jgi:predicted nucleic acid-binding protein
MAAPDAPVYVSTATLAELEVGCCIGPTDRAEAQTEIREVIRTNKLSVLDFTKHTAAEYGALKAALMLKYNREQVKKNKAKWPEVWTTPNKGATLGVDEFDLLVVSHAIERRLVLVTIDPMLRILDGIIWPNDCPKPVSWI